MTSATSGERALHPVAPSTIADCLDAEAMAQRWFLCIATLVFAVSSAMTVQCSSSVSMGDMTMPGGWTMSMMWMRMPGQTWPGAAASFLGMWMVMMIAMMVPSLAPTLLRYRRAAATTGEALLWRLTARIAIGYFLVWAGFGMVAFALGAALAAAEMRMPALSRAIPILVGVVVAMAGAVQFSAWKRRHLACWRKAPTRIRIPANAATTWRHGVRLGLQCFCCCANLMTILLVVGVMDLAVMTLVTLAMTVERVATASRRVVQAIGLVVVGAGVWLILRGAGLE